MLIFKKNRMDFGKKIYVIAEIGINHNGKLEYAFDLIKIAKSCGCDAVKFQKRDIDIVYTKEFLDSPRKSPWGNTQRDQKEGLEFGIEEYKEIDKFCKSIGIEWFVSCWDINSQQIMRQFKTRYNKVASAMATHHKFLKVVAEERKPTFLSTGMTSLDQIRQACDIFDSYNCPVTLMHTVSTYPAKEEDLNLKCIKTLKDEFGKPVGYSGHESSVTPSIYAASLGASCIERHITLDRAMYGSDQSASLQESGLRSLVGSLNKFHSILGDGIKRIIPEEVEVANKLRYWKEE